MCTSNKYEPLSDGEEKAGVEEGEDTLDAGTPPVFTELLLRMIDQLSDDIVSWSTAGDSFIIKQARKKRQAAIRSLATWKHHPSSACILLVPREDKNMFSEVEHHVLVMNTRA